MEKRKTYLRILSSVRNFSKQMVDRSLMQCIVEKLKRIRASFLSAVDAAEENEREVGSIARSLEGDFALNGL